ncbi:dUTP diphosphatase [Microlunatus parietis]|uniref:Deoxyuridine 5'-triphosphate nucleotidohydrolase n=1 Tax=Microlunatus parietis TaxID=682979 RepID=A0A7Y9LD55_9ACTN|nr:dUTP diphosphatase [Microlunatus parietis]NYE75539.1 dUTP pyrophosphatase [Microlunatus parietis]
MPQLDHAARAQVIPATETVRVELLRLDPGLEPPDYARPGDAGADLRSSETATLEPGERRVFGTGVAIALPEGYAAFVHPRSGLAARHGITVVNAPGTVDAGYRGEIKVCLINTDRSEPVTINRGDRIAQLVVQRVSRAEFVAVEALPESVRGAGGYGSTGGHASLVDTGHTDQA